MKSREYLFGGLAGTLPMPSAAYTDRIKTCQAAAAMPNVKDAYILRDGGIAVVPKQNTISATAATLSQFCDTYPTSTLRFLSQKDLLLNRSLPDIVRISSTSATTCKKVKGLDY
ncbi:MAG: hypothetical protein K2W78_01970 [Xanthobacteraceae bacterium]|nr:hypothetical protein [Xanthobacteraceae bacterium]